MEEVEGEMDCLSAWGASYPLIPLEGWMRELVPDGVYAVDMGGHIGVLRAGKSVKGQEYFNFCTGGENYGAVFVG